MIKSFYNFVNENLQEDLSFEEVSRLAELDMLSGDLLKIYNYVKNGSSGELDLAHSELTHLPNWLTKVTGILRITGSNVEDIPDLLTLNYSIFASHSKIKEFRKTEVFGSLGLNYTQITKLPDNLIVHGYLSVEGIQFEQFPTCLVTEGELYIYNSNLEQFSDEELRKMFNISSSIVRREIEI